MCGLLIRVRGLKLCLSLFKQPSFHVHVFQGCNSVLRRQVHPVLMIFSVACCKASLSLLLNPVFSKGGGEVVMVVWKSVFKKTYYLLSKILLHLLSKYEPFQFMSDTASLSWECYPSQLSLRQFYSIPAPQPAKGMKAYLI